MVNSMVIIVSLITLTWSVNYCSSATIVDPGNIFDRYNPIRSIVGAQSYDNAKLNAFTLPERVIQGVSNIALAPWKGNDFSSRGGKLPNLGNIFSGVPVIGSLVSRPSSSAYGASGNNFGPMAPVEFARAPGSGSSASASASASGSVSGQQPRDSMNFNPNLSSRPTQYGSASSSVNLPSTSSSRPLSGPSSSSSSSSQLPSLSLGPMSDSGSSSAAQPSLSMDPSIASALRNFGFNLDNFRVNGSPAGSSSASSGASASIRPSSGGLSASASAGSSQSSGPSFGSSYGSSSGSSSGSLSGSSPFGSFGSFMSSPSTPGLGQASNFLSNLFSFPLNG